MERASKFIRALGLPPGMLSPEIWRAPPGRRPSARRSPPTRAPPSWCATSGGGSRDAICAVVGLRSQIVRSLEKSVGPGLGEVEFRIVPRRIEPRRAVVSTPSLTPDEASLIADPVLRNIYKASRKKALA
jgi:hypothetical protein